MKIWEDSLSADTWDIALADIDNDSDLDALIANEGLQNSSSVLLLNDGTGVFNESDFIFPFSESLASAAEDLKGTILLTFLLALLPGLNVRVIIAPG